jgi:hypothetical protein
MPPTQKHEKRERTSARVAQPRLRIEAVDRRQTTIVCRTLIPTGIVEMAKLQGQASLDWTGHKER